MSDDKPSIFDLYSGESEPITLSDPAGRSFSVKFLKRTEAQRLEAIKYADSQKSRYIEAMAERRAEIRNGPFSRLDKNGIVDTMAVFIESSERARGLDLLDDLEPDDADAPTTVQELEAQREERLKSFMDDRRKELEERDEGALFDDLVEMCVQSEYSISTSADHFEMTVVLTCVDAETGERIFDSIDQLRQVTPQVLQELRDRLNEFMMAENEPKARELAADPNS